MAAPELCSRPLSREAALAASALQRAAAQAGVAPSPACPLQAQLGMFAAQEAVKLRRKDKHWVCQACGRSFMSQHWVDVHLRDRHSGDGGGGPGLLRALPVAGVCLADYCGMLGCPGLAEGGAEGGAAAEGEARCLRVLTECFPEAASLAAEGEGAALGAGADASALLRRRDFFLQQRAQLCHSTHAQRAANWAEEAAREGAFKWTPARAAGAAGAVAVFLALLWAIVREDIRSPIKGLKERTREREREREAAARAAEARAAAQAEGKARAAAGGQEAQAEEEVEAQAEEETEAPEAPAAPRAEGLRRRG